MKEDQQNAVKNLWPGEILPEQISVTSSVRYVSRIVVELQIFITNNDVYHLNERTRIMHIIKSRQRRRLNDNDAGPYLVFYMEDNTKYKSESKSDSGLEWYIIFVAVICPVMVVAFLAAIFIYYIYKIIPTPLPAGDIDLLIQKNHLTCFKIDEIISATDNFDDSNLLGEGGFGKVYKANDLRNQVCAVKRSNASENVKIDDFRKELFTISTTSHKNIVHLIGYCEENNEKILVYEFMHHGSLKGHLSPRNRKPGVNLILNFAQRVNVALGAAEGLRYLHCFTKPPLLHRDVKTDNILLSEDLESKVSDFGLSTNLNPEGAENEHAFLAGTMGYIDPELFHGVNVSTKSDVYSFGVILLELLTGKPAIMLSTMEGGDKPIRISLTSWAIPLIDAGDIHTLMDPVLRASYPEAAAKRFAELALSCLERRGRERPEMSQITNSLAEIKLAVIEDKNFNVDLNLPLLESGRDLTSQASSSVSGSGVLVSSGKNDSTLGSNVYNSSMYSDAVPMSEIIPR